MPRQVRKVIEIEGLDPWRAQFRRARAETQLVLERSMATAVRVAEAQIVPRAPIDTGRLRQSIHPIVHRQPGLVIGIIGTSLHYAPYQEYGTGLLAEGVGGKGKRHHPPPAAMELWAKRHGFESGKAAAWAIYKRGGVKPKRFFREGLKAAEDDIGRLFEAALDKLVRGIA